MTLDAVLVTAIVGTVLPLAVALATKLNAAPGLKAVLLLALSIANGLITTATQLDGTAVISREALLLALMSFITGVATHFGLFKPVQAQAKLLPDKGLGPPG